MKAHSLADGCNPPVGNTDKEFLHIEFNGKVQIVTGKNEIDRNLIYVLVAVAEIGSADEFYIFTKGDLQDQIHDHYVSYLEKHDGVRPRNWEITHCTYFVENL